MVFRQDRERVELDSLVGQRADLVGRCLAVDAALLHLVVMDTPGLCGKAVADVIGVVRQMFSELPQHRDHFRLLGGSGMGGDAHRILLARRRNGGRHQRLLHIGVSADRAGDGALAPLRLEGVRAGEPALELMPVRAGQREADHDAVRSATGSAASGSANGRSFFSAGILWRASSERAGSIAATITSGPSPPASASTSPHGATMMEWPNVSRPSAWRPACAAEMTKAPFSMARARCRTCQCASPVWRVKAAGAVSAAAPACACARKSCGKRMS